MAEMYGLLLGIQLAKERGISGITIAGDSLITIKFLQIGTTPNANKLNLLLQELRESWVFLSIKACNIF